MKKNYFKIIHELLNKENLTQEDILKAFNFYERKQLFLSFGINNEIIYKFIKRCNKEKIFLFTKEEFNIINASGINHTSLVMLFPKEIFQESVQKGNYIGLSLKGNSNLLEFEAEELKTLVQMTIDNINLANIDNMVNRPPSDFIFFKETFYSSIELIMEAFKSIRDDNFKEKILNEIINNLTKTKRYKYLEKDYLCQLVSLFDNDYVKEKWFKRLKENEIFKVISTFSDDNKKISYLFTIGKNNRNQILLSLKDQDLIRRLIKNPFISKIVIMQIEDEKEREEYFRKLFTMIGHKDKGLIVASFSSREKQLELLELLNTEIARYHLILASKVLTEEDIIKICNNFRSEQRIIDVLSMIHNVNEKNKLYLKLKNHKYIMDIARDLKDMDVFKELIDKLSESELKKLYTYIGVNEVNSLLLVLLKIKDRSFVMRKLEHINLVDFQIADFSPFVEMYAKFYKLNKSHLEIFVHEYGYGVFKYIKSQKIRETINQDDETFKKYIQLLKKSNFISDEHSFKNMLDILAQENYKTSANNIINIFSNLVHLLEEEIIDDQQLRSLIETIVQLSNVPAFLIFQNLNIEPCNSSKLITVILERLKEKDNRVILEYMHKLSGLAIDNHRNSKIKDYVGYKFEITKKQIDEKEFLNYYLYGCDIEKLKTELFNYFSFFDEEERLFINSNRFNDVIKFKQNPSSILINDSLKKDLHLFEIIIKKLYKFIGDKKEIRKLINYFIVSANKIEYDNSHDLEYIFSILQNIDSNQLREMVFDNQEKYQSLLNFISTNKLLGLLPLIRNSNELGIKIDEGLITNLINNYDAIYKAVINNSGEKAKIAEMLIKADYYNSESFRYENLLGREVFPYIISNPGPNSATMDKKNRLNKATELIKKTYERKYLTVPPQDETYNLSTGKSINVRLGDIHSLNNLVYGEMTGACMRIGGAGESLFDFCLLNESGFHLIFNDPITGNFISRVSGFRNGNTIFFNQLRSPEDEKYDEKDLVECLKEASKKIIEDSKGSPYPIDNVVISDGYSMAGQGDLVDLGVRNIKSGLKKFYSDVKSEAIVLATSATDAPFVPLKLATKVPKYEGLKPEISYFVSKNATMQINHLKTLKEFLNGTSIEKIDIIEEEILACYATDFWAIYINSKKEIKTIIVENDKNLSATVQALLSEMKAKLIEMGENYDKSR